MPENKENRNSHSNNENPKAEIVIRLKRIRQILGYGRQSDFGTSIGLSQGGYSDIERGKNNLSPRVKKNLQEVHKVNLRYLETGEEPIFLEPGKSETESVFNSNLKIECLLKEIENLKSEKNLLIDLVSSQKKTIETLEKLITTSSFSN